MTADLFHVKFRNVILLPDKPSKGLIKNWGGGGMDDFRKNILRTDFGGKFLQGNTRPGEKKFLPRKKNLSWLIIVKKIGN